MNDSLPPMPGSDRKSFEENNYDSFYKTTPRNMWKDNVIERIPEPKMTKCNHFFKYVSDGVRCTQCSFGLLGHLEIRKGKLYSENKKIGI